jgi:site-specific DNA-cytosine methylase
MSHPVSVSSLVFRHLVENDKLTAAVLDVNHLKSNHGDAVVFPEDVESYLTKVENGDAPYEIKYVDHVHASSPCQGFSKVRSFRV